MRDMRDDGAMTCTAPVKRSGRSSRSTCPSGMPRPLDRSRDSPHQRSSGSRVTPGSEHDTDPASQPQASHPQHLQAVHFGVLAEMDLAATLKKKLDADIPGQVILGACNPPALSRR
jgi:hypothetical protein